MISIYFKRDERAAGEREPPAFDHVMLRRDLLCIISRFPVFFLLLFCPFNDYHTFEWRINLVADASLRNARARSVFTSLAYAKRKHSDYGLMFGNIMKLETPNGKT